MLLSWVLDHSDGEVRRFRGEDSNLDVYLDRFTHRVSYPLMHIGMGVSLWRYTDAPGYFVFGATVAYFYQLGVAHTLDKTLMAHERGGVNGNPLGTVRQRLTARLPSLSLPLKCVVGGYSQLIQNNTFVVLLSIAALLGYVREFYLSYGTILIGNWMLITLLDFSVTFRQDERAGEPTDSTRGDLDIQMH